MTRPDNPTVITTDAYRAAQTAARRAVQSAVASGRLVRPSKCSRCPNGGPVQAHHFMGYEPEHHLDVLWLCRTCHSFAPRQARTPIQRRGYRRPTALAALYEAADRLERERVALHAPDPRNHRPGGGLAGRPYSGPAPVAPVTPEPPRAA